MYWRVGYFILDYFILLHNMHTISYNLFILSQHPISKYTYPLIPVVLLRHLPVLPISPGRSYSPVLLAFIFFGAASSPYSSKGLLRFSYADGLTFSSPQSALVPSVEAAMGTATETSAAPAAAATAGPGIAPPSALTLESAAQGFTLRAARDGGGLNGGVPGLNRLGGGNGGVPGLNRLGGGVEGPRLGMVGFSQSEMSASALYQYVSPSVALLCWVHGSLAEPGAWTLEVAKWVVTDEKQGGRDMYAYVKDGA